MTLSDLMTLFRTETDDTVAPYLWSDDELIDFANDAQLEACRRARLLVDSSTSAITQIALSAGQALVALDPRVLFVRRARFAGGLPLRRMTMQDMEAYDPYWLDTQDGTPRAFVPDYETGKIRLWPGPAQTMSLQLTVVRDPLVDMQADDDVPEIAPRYHRSLRFWMMARAYGKQDAQANDPKKELNSMALFEQEFGKKSSAIDEAWIEREQVEGDGTF